MKRILELKAPGKMREFEGELAKFRKQYPDYLLPEELKGAQIRVLINQRSPSPQPLSHQGRGT